MAEERRVALLRAVNVGGRKVPMAQLRQIAEDLGWHDVATYIQSGNLVFTATGTRGELEAKLAAALEAAFGFEVPVLVRGASEWSSIVAANPLQEAAEADPRRLMLALAQEPIAGNCLETLREVAGDVERVERAGEAIWIHFREGSARSRITPKVLDRAAGSPVTTRNWRTVVRLDAMLADS